MWHASASYHPGRTGGLNLEQWAAPIRRETERELKRLLADVGAGPRKWQKGSPRGGHVLHVRRSLSDRELAELPPGPQATVPGGAFGGLYRCQFVAP